jgi:hypothetical protein
MRVLVTCAAVLLLSLSAFGQQPYVSRYDLFAGLANLTAPKVNLYERGVNSEFGVNVRRWLALGADFSYLEGHSSLLPSQLSTTQQAMLAPFLPLLPPGASISVPYDAQTYTFAAGPQFSLRKLRWVTLFARPALGALHEKVTAKPDNPIGTAVVAALVPTGQKSDTVVFYGFGGGIDFNLSKHVALRAHADFIHVNLFAGFLNGSRNSGRFAVGPAFRWGSNVSE